MALIAGPPGPGFHYAGIIQLVSEAEQSQAPFVRLADRYAMWFLPLTVAVAGAAWALGGAERAVAVLSWPRRARSSWRHRLPWCRGCPRRRDAGWW